MRQPVKHPNAGGSDENRSAHGSWSEVALLLGKVSGMGWFLAACVALGTFGGYRLGEWLGIAPWFTIGGLLLGLAVAVVGIYRIVKVFWNTDSGSEKAEIEGNDESEFE